MSALPSFMRRALQCATLAFGIGLAPMAQAAAYSGLYVFGDSLSDVGNVSALTGGLLPVAPYAPGRFTNGPVAAEWLALGLGLNASQFHDFAFGGATTGAANLFALLGNTGVLSQVGFFQSQLGATPADASAMYMVWGGPNDFFTPTGLLDPATSTHAAANIGASVSSLYALGARDFLVPLMPNLAFTPRFAGEPSQPAALLQSLAYDLQLTDKLNELQASLPGIHITRFNTSALLLAAISNPGAFGFSNVTDACVTGSFTGVSAVCATPDTYLFWDDVHPTARGHEVLGRAMSDAVLAAAVPEPEQAALLLAGLAVLPWAARRRGRALTPVNGDA